jgi:methanogenic corrinoid protein MtbC1
MRRRFIGAFRVNIVFTSGIAASSTMKDEMISTVNDVEQLFEIDEIYMTEILRANRTMQAMMYGVKPYHSAREAHQGGAMRMAKNRLSK